MTTTPTKIKTNSKLLAHRGYSEKYPENTLLAIRSALELGSSQVEIDVHLSQDLVPIVIHDKNLNRTCNRDGEVHLMQSTELMRCSAHYADKFGDRYQPEPIPTLAQVVELMKQWPDRIIFVEVKRATIERFGVDTVLEKIVELLKPIKKQCVVISYSAQVPLKARDLGMKKVGWVFEDWGEAAEQTAKTLQADFLMSDYEVVEKSKATLWPGPWQWVLYAVDDVEIARDWLQKGADIIETNNIELLLKEL